MERDLSIKDLIKKALKEDFKGLSIDAEKVFLNVEKNELMLNIINLNIYNSILNELEKKNTKNIMIKHKIAEIKNKIGNYKINELKGRIVRSDELGEYIAELELIRLKEIQEEYED